MSTSVPSFFELLSSGLLKEKHPSLLGIYIRVIEGANGYPMYRQFDGDGCVDVTDGFWRIYKFGGNFNVMWNHCEIGSLKPPVAMWRLGTGRCSDPLDTSTRINTNEDQIKKEYKKDDLDGFMKWQTISKIDKYNGEFDELNNKWLHDFKDNEYKFIVDLNQLETWHDGEIQTMVKEEEKELIVLKSKYSEMREKIIKEKKLKHENLRANYMDVKKVMEEYRDNTITCFKETIETFINIYKDYSKPDNELNLKVKHDLECPVCLQEMKPPAHIFDCNSGHLICGECRARLVTGAFFEIVKCPTCRVQNIKGRNLAMERFVRTLYGHQ